MFPLHCVGAGQTYTYSPGALSRQAGLSRTRAVLSVHPTQTTPVPPVDKITSVQKDSAQSVIHTRTQLPLMREGADPAEVAVRSRIQYLDDADLSLSGAQDTQSTQETKSPQEIMEEGECQTCKERKYQDQSDDPGVSYQTPTNIAPEQAAAAVRGHEQEHVVREQAKAKQEDREVVSQSVSLHTAICPECGKVYVSGGTTRTTTRAERADSPTVSESQPSRRFQAVA